ncbi:MAG: hypothetical protein AB8G99_00530 [Planctomycetaceae bacterium]
MRVLLPAILMVVLTGGSAFSQGRETVVFLSPEGPFFLGVNLTVNGTDFREWLSSYLFDRMDGNRDKQMNASEISLMPPALLTRLGHESAEKLADAILSGNESVTKTQFVGFLKERLSTPFLISEKQQSAVQAINILPKFDADNDGHLSEDELQNALKHQAQQDIDDDEALSAAELLPFRDQQPGVAAAIAPNTDDLPFIQVVDGAQQKLAEKLVRYYSQGDETKLTQQGTHLTEEQFQGFDADSDGKWDASEVASFLQKPVHHVSIDVRFFTRGRAKLEHRILTQHASVATGESKKKDRLTLELSGLPISIRCDQYLSSSARFTRSFCGQRFSVSDQDRNKYLDEGEFGSFAGAVAGSVGPLDFATLDANDDEMVTREELFRHLDRDTLAAQSQLETTISSDGKSMFMMLDENLDRRLSMRELKSGFDKLAALDRDSDRRVSRIEASSPSQYTLQIGLGRPQLFRNMSGQSDMMMSTNTVVRGTAGLDGPLWFRKMDRNRDGDVSRREFLGTSSQFDSLDTDKDELLDATEAEAAKSTQSTQK